MSTARREIRRPTATTRRASASACPRWSASRATSAPRTTGICAAARAACRATATQVGRSPTRPRATSTPVSASAWRAVVARSATSARPATGARRGPAASVSLRCLGTKTERERGEAVVFLLFVGRVSECHCNIQGSESNDCDKHTGECRCRKGIVGRYCDQCAKGYVGKAPNCRACGECFDNWAEIQAQISSEYLVPRPSSRVSVSSRPS